MDGIILFYIITEEAMRKRISLVICMLVFNSMLSTMRVYNGLNAGIAWDWGGIELVGDVGLFTCPPLPYAVDC